jgi:hypothetical protein
LSVAGGAGEMPDPPAAFSAACASRREILAAFVSGEYLLSRAKSGKASALSSGVRN